MGFLGDPQAGAHLPRNLSGISIEDDWRQLLFHSHALSSPDTIAPLLPDAFPDGRALEQCCIDTYIHTEDFPEQHSIVQLSDNWDFYNRQRKSVTYSINQNWHRGYNYRYPFTDPEVLAFTKSLPPESRKGCVAFRKGFYEQYREFFSLPSTRTYGGKGTWHEPSLLQKCLNLGSSAIRNKILRGHFDPYININYIPFWEYCDDRWEVIPRILDIAKKYDFLERRLMESDLEAIRRKRTYAYKRGPEYHRLLGMIHVLMTLDTLNVAVDF